MYPGLSLDQAPPILVPFRFFLTAPVFGILASLFAFYYGSDLLGSRWLPSMLALTHLFTLGVLSMVMIGALFQMLPVVAGSAIAFESRVSIVVYLLLTTGTSLLTFGFYQRSSLLIFIASIAIGFSLILFIVAATHALWRAPRRHDSVRGMQFAIIGGLSTTVVLGLILALGHAWDDIPLWREQLTPLHILWGTLGWISLLVGVIAYQVVPMFQMTPEYPSVLRRYWAGSLFGLLIVASLVIFSSPSLLLITHTLLALLLVVFAVITLRLQRLRKRRLPDVTLNFWRMGMVALIAAVGVYQFNSVWPQPRFELLIGTLFTLGFTLSVINGMLYKIVPFLVWLHLQNHLLATMQLGKIRIPNMKEIIPSNLLKRQFWVHLSALGLLILAVIVGDPLFRPAWGLFVISFSLLGYNLLFAYRCYRRELKRISELA